MRGRREDRTDGSRLACRWATEDRKGFTAITAVCAYSERRAHGHTSPGLPTPSASVYTRNRHSTLITRGMGSAPSPLSSRCSDRAQCHPESFLAWYPRTAREMSLLVHSNGGGSSTNNRRRSSSSNSRPWWQQPWWHSHASSGEAGSGGGRTAAEAEERVKGRSSPTRFAKNRASAAHTTLEIGCPECR